MKTPLTVFLIAGGVFISLVSFFFGYERGHLDGYRHGSCDYAGEVLPNGAVATYCRMHGYQPQKWEPR